MSHLAALCSWCRLPTKWGYLQHITGIAKEIGGVGCLQNGGTYSKEHIRQEMFTLRVLGSSSSGNCYLLEADDGVLIIETGVRLSEVKKALRWQINRIVGAVVSHEHNDHAGYIKEYLQAGIQVLALQNVFDAKRVSGHPFARPVNTMHGYIVGGFKVFTIPVAHDVPCIAFIIEHEEMGRLFFITDTMMLEYRLPKINHWLLECNYSDKILRENIDNGIVPSAMKPRLLHSHMELETAKGILRANDLSATKEIVLIHLSDNNSDPYMFTEEIEGLIGVPTYIAEKGLTIELQNIIT